MENTYDPTRNTLLSRQNKTGTTIVSRYDYTVNAIGQRTDVSQAGTAFAAARSITWGYDSLGQVTSADSSIPGLDRSYQYDTIGNRLKTADSLTLPGTANYTVNALNQYTAIGANTPTYDAAGNATAYPLPADTNANSTLIWDAENRLIEVREAGTSVPFVSFVYDSQSRRIAKTEGTETSLTIYDGWNPIAEWSGGQTTTLTKTYLWGMDLSGTMQGAGGVGGLLAVTQEGSTYYPTYDGNGNVSEYLDSTGAVAAHYEYDPFGKATVATGSKAADFSHRFSTKPLDLVTGLYYYGYRYYDPVTGRCPSRDPIEEDGGINLYAFVGNDGVNGFDLLGLKKKCSEYSKTRALNGVDEGRTTNQNGQATGNGCGTASGVRPPQGFGATSFTAACDAHDVCYGTCGSDKSQCDQQFGDDLANACKSGQTGIWKALCLADAATYKNAVIAVGGPAYNSAQDEFCEWEECCND